MLLREEALPLAATITLQTVGMARDGGGVSCDFAQQIPYFPVICGVSLRQRSQMSCVLHVRLRLGFVWYCAEFSPCHQRFSPFLFGNDAADVAGDTAEPALVPGDMPVRAEYVGCRLCGGCGHSLAVFYGAKIRKFRRSGTFSYMIRSGEGPAVLSPLPCSGVCRCQSLTSGRVL